ncbi:MAG: CHAD domain-containing protein [Geobacter sp.]|nr:CHAD domain-containing protein [Geobacter sp.]
MRGVTADTHTWLAARAFLRERCDDFYLQVTKVRESFDPEAIHDLRVSSRRLREWLDVFAACFRKRQVSGLRKELKGLTTYLGTIRNSDEALLFFSAMTATVAPESSSALQAIIAELQAGRDVELKKLKQELKRVNPAALLERIDGLCLDLRMFDPDSGALFRPVADALLNAVAQREKSILEILPEALQESAVLSQHRLRIAVKRFRYRLEFLAPIATQNTYHELHSAVKKYQEVLGHMHDLDVFDKTVDEIAAAQTGAGLIKAAIARLRHELFNEFMLMNSNAPLPLIIDRVRSLT